MAKLVYALNQSLDGYVDHMAFAPDATLFRHFIADVLGLEGMIYGRTMYEIMAYWDDEQCGWGEDERAYAAAWRSKPKWVVSRTLKSVGPNATLISGDVESAIGRIKSEHAGTIEIAGPVLAGSLADSGLIDEYQIYLHPVVVGGGKPYFTQVTPRLRLVATDRIGPDAIRLTYVRA